MLFEELQENDVQVFTGLDDCIIGSTITNGKMQAVYSASAILMQLSNDMTEDEALEHFDYNIVGSLQNNPEHPIILNDILATCMQYEEEKQLE